jgi:transposase-like protein
MGYVNQAIKFTVREQKGNDIAKADGQVKRIDEHSYKVKSQTSDNEYDVLNTELGFICSCCDHVYRGVKCKHIYAVQFSLELRKKVESSIVIQPVNSLACRYCNSDKVVKKAIRHNKYGDIQRYLCKSCGKRFSFNVGFERMHATPQVITSAMQLYFTGESFRNVQKFLRLQGLNVSHMGVYKWIEKYVSLMNKYLEQVKPNVSDIWRTDELYLKVKGDTKYLYALMDDQTRFWIAQQVADSKYSQDIQPMRGLKRIDTPILTGYQIFHNYVRPHEGLNGITPAEACGIQIEGNDRWRTLIENASHKF